MLEGIGGPWGPDALGDAVRTCQMQHRSYRSFLEAVGDLRATLLGSPGSPDAKQASACRNCAELHRRVNKCPEASADACEDGVQP